MWETVYGIKIWNEILLTIANGWERDFRFYSHGKLSLLFLQNISARTNELVRNEEK